jgi:glycosyltransferase involved in cell wall biosynthesis
MGIKSFHKSEAKQLKVYTRKTTESTDDYEEIVSLCRENSDRVTMVANAPQDELFKSLLGARGFIFPSKFESCGLVSFEAMSAGCPVIYTVPDADYFLTQSPHNVKVPRRTVGAYSEAINQVDREEADKVGVWNMCKKKWSHEGFKGKVKALLEKHTL